jgi:hypothetical protein
VVLNDVSIVNFTFSLEFSRAIEVKKVAEQAAKQAEFIALKASKERMPEAHATRSQKLIELKFKPKRKDYSGKL